MRNNNSNVSIYLQPSLAKLGVIQWVDRQHQFGSTSPRTAFVVLCSFISAGLEAKQRQKALCFALLCVSHAWLWTAKAVQVRSTNKLSLARGCAWLQWLVCRLCQYKSRAHVLIAVLIFNHASGYKRWMLQDCTAQSRYIGILQYLHPFASQLLHSPCGTTTADSKMERVDMIGKPWKWTNAHL